MTASLTAETLDGILAPQYTIAWAGALEVASAVDEAITARTQPT